MPRKQANFQCYRCGYETTRKDNMNTHLNRLVKPCPPSLNSTELTDSIKEKILKYRIFTPDDVSKIDQKSVNNYNFLGNVILHANTVDKLESVSEMLNYLLDDYETLLENCFSGNIKRLEDKSLKAPYVLSEVNILNCFNRATQINQDLAKFAVYYDNKTNLNKYKLVTDGKP